MSGVWARVCRFMKQNILYHCLFFLKIYLFHWYITVLIPTNKQNKQANKNKKGKPLESWFESLWPAKLWAGSEYSLPTEAEKAWEMMHRFPDVQKLLTPQQTEVFDFSGRFLGTRSSISRGCSTDEQQNHQNVLPNCPLNFHPWVLIASVETQAKNK